MYAGAEILMYDDMIGGRPPSGGSRTSAMWSGSASLPNSANLKRSWQNLKRPGTPRRPKVYFLDPEPTSSRIMCCQSTLSSYQTHLVVFVAISLSSYQSHSHQFHLPQDGGCDEGRGEGSKGAGQNYLSLYCSIYFGAAYPTEHVHQFWLSPSTRLSSVGWAAPKYMLQYKLR